MAGRKKPLAELDEKDLDSASAGSDKGYVVTHVDHTAATQAAKPKFFAGVVNRTSQ